MPRALLRRWVDEIEAFLAVHVATTKGAIRQNCASVTERLGFLGRVLHGSNPRMWLRSLTARLGEAADCSQVASEGEFICNSKRARKLKRLPLSKAGRGSALRTSVSSSWTRTNEITWSSCILRERYVKRILLADPDFVEELEGWNTETEGIEGTLRDLDRDKIKIH